MELVGYAAGHYFVLQIDDDALRRPHTNAFHAFQHPLVATSDDVAEFLRRDRREDHPRRIGSHTRDGDEQAIKGALLYRGKAVEGVAVVAASRDDCLVDVELHLPLPLKNGIGVEGDAERIADTRRLNDGLRRGERSQLASYIFYHIVVCKLILIFS